MFIQSIVNDINTLSSPLRVRLLANFLQKLITEGMTPFVLLYLVVQQGQFWAGVIGFVILGLGVFVNAYGGKKTAYQNIKNTLILGELLQFVSVVLMAVFAHSLFFILLYLLKNLVFSYLVPFSEVFVFELTDKDKRAVLYQLTGLANGLATPIGALLGGVLYGFGLSVLLYGLSFVSFLVFLLYWFGFAHLKPSLTHKIADEQSTKDNRFSILLGNKMALYLLLSSVFIHSLFFSLNQLLPAYLSQLDNAVELLSSSRAINGVVALAAGFLLLGIIKKISRFTPIIWTSMFYGVGFVLLFLSVQNKWSFYGLSALLSVLYFILSVGIKTIYANQIDKSAGIYLSAFALTGRFGNIIASLVLIASAFIGYPLAVGLLGVLGVFAVLCLWRAKRV